MCCFLFDSCPFQDKWNHSKLFFPTLKKHLFALEKRKLDNYPTLVTSKLHVYSDIHQQCCTVCSMQSKAVWMITWKHLIHQDLWRTFHWFYSSLFIHCDWAITIVISKITLISHKDFPNWNLIQIGNFGMIIEDNRSLRLWKSHSSTLIP